MKFEIGQEPGGGGYIWQLRDDDHNVVARCPVALESRELVELEISDLKRGAAQALANFDAARQTSGG